MQYISTHLYRKMVHCALQEGLDREALQALPTSVEDMGKISAVPADHFFWLHEYLDDQLGPGFAVRVGQEMKIDDYGVLGLSWRTCSRAGEIFERSERYFKLLSNTYLWQIEQNGPISHVYLRREPHRRGLELSNEASLSATVVVLKAITEKNISPINVSFQHGPPPVMNSHQKAFNCNIDFHADAYIISYKTTDLETRTAKADESINNFLLERVDEETQGIEVSGSKVIQDVQQLIQDALPGGIPSIHEVAHHLGMSNRTLTRRLSDGGCSFRDLIQKAQERIAKELLTDHARSVAEIAFQTGFSEQSAFNRAFKRWTGLSPIEFRKSS